MIYIELLSQMAVNGELGEVLFECHTGKRRHRNALSEIEAASLVSELAHLGSRSVCKNHRGKQRCCVAPLGKENVHAVILKA